MQIPEIKALGEGNTLRACIEKTRALGPVYLICMSARDFFASYFTVSAVRAMQI
jgi:hypothetical protein